MRLSPHSVIAFTILVVVGTLFFQLDTPKLEAYAFIMKRIDRVFRFSPEDVVDEDTLQAKLKAPTPLWMTEQITNDLSRYPRIEAPMLDKLLTDYNSCSNMFVRFTVADGRVSLSAPDDVLACAFSMRPKAFKMYQSMLDYLAYHKLIPDVSFVASVYDVVTLPDHIPMEKRETLPYLMFSRDNNHPWEQEAILAPDWMNMITWPFLKKRIDLANKSHPWEEKKKKIFWRGGMADSTDYRRKVTQFSRLNKNTEHVEARMTQGEFAAKNMLPEHHLNYAYQLTIDGIRCTWERFVWQLYSNSLVIKPESTQIQWFYNALKPGIHYVETTNDPQDLLSLRKWLVEHDDEAKLIAHNAHDFVVQNLMIEDMYLYWIVLLREYAARQQFAVTHPANATRIPLSFKESIPFLVREWL